MPNQMLDAQLQLTAGDWKFATSGERSTLKATVCAAGTVRNGANQPTRMQVPFDVLQDAHGRGLFDNLACFVDHESFLGGATMPRMAGTWGDSEVNDEQRRIEATLYFYTNAAAEDIKTTINDIIEDADAGRPVPDVGISLDFYGEFERQEDAYFLTSIIHIRSADIVFMPATDSRIHGAFSATYQISEDISMDLEEVTQEAADAPAPNQAQQQSVQFSAPLREDEGFVAARQQADAALAVIVQSAVNQLILASGLPANVQNTLRQRSFATVEAAQQAIADAQGIAAAIEENRTVQMGAAGRRDAQVGSTPMESAQDIMDYFFGAIDAPVPEPQMRSLRNFYVALTGDGDFHGAFQPDRVQFAGATTTDLPNLARNAMNKVVSQMWEGAALNAYRWWEKITTIKPNDGSVHAMEFIVVGGTGALPTVAEKGAYTELTPGDTGEQAAFGKKGGYVGITLEMMRNSDIQRLQAIPRALVRDAIRTRSAAVAALFTTASGVGPNLRDTNPLFHASGSNVATTAFDAAAWKAARLEAYKHVEPGSSKRIGVYPKYALVPADLYETALAAFGYGEGFPTSYNVYAEERGMEDPRPIPLAVPEWTDTNDWAYVQDPSAWETVCISYANDPSGRSHPAPELYTVTSETVGLMFTNDTMPIKVRDWYALGVTGRVGIGKRNVA